MPRSLNTSKQSTKSADIYRKTEKETEDEGWFEVEAILDVRERAKNKKQYLINWAGFGPDENSWEPLSNLRNVKDMVEKFEAKRQKSSPEKKPTAKSRSRSRSKTRASKSSPKKGPGRPRTPSRGRTETKKPQKSPKKSPARTKKTQSPSKSPVRTRSSSRGRAPPAKKTASKSPEKKTSKTPMEKGPEPELAPEPILLPKVPQKRTPARVAEMKPLFTPKTSTPKPEPMKALTSTTKIGILSASLQRRDKVDEPPPRDISTTLARFREAENGERIRSLRSRTLEHRFNHSDTPRKPPATPSIRTAKRGRSFLKRYEKCILGTLLILVFCIVVGSLVYFNWPTVAALLKRMRRRVPFLK